MREALHVKGSQGDTEWNSAIREKLCVLSRARPPRHQQKRKAVGNKARGGKEEQAAAEQYPT